MQFDAVEPADKVAAAGGLRPFEREALAYALDGDTVQNLLRLAAERWPDMSKDAGLRVLRGLLDHGLLRIYEDGAKVLHDLDAATLLHERITAQFCTWLEATPDTMARLSTAVPRTDR